MVTSAKVYLGVDSRSSQLIKQIINSRQWVPILDRNPVQLSVINAQSKGLVLLLLLHAWLPCRGLAGRVATQPKPCLLLPWSQYTEVYCDTVPSSSANRQPVTIQSEVYRDMLPSNYTPYIEIQFPPLQYTHKPFKPPKTCCVTIQFPIVL